MHIKIKTYDTLESCLHYLGATGWNLGLQLVLISSQDIQQNLETNGADFKLNLENIAGRIPFSYNY